MNARLRQIEIAILPKLSAEKALFQYARNHLVAICAAATAATVNVKNPLYINLQRCGIFGSHFGKKCENN
jgi:hypothetical protein